MTGSISACNLGKAYKIYSSRLTRLREWLDPFSRERHKLKWVLRDLNFTVAPGEAVAIIGVNGAGKSTLLKMLTGTTQPTLGSVQVNGRVAALLELGLGFHTEFTGRQNAIMAGQLMGIDSAEMHQLMPHIVAFAEIGDYFDQPVRVYSSGMQMRLAFSVATARRPDILIVDEALAVGDVYFQHKSLERIREFQAAGSTLLFVSHDSQSILSICSRAILLQAGHIVQDGVPEAVLDFYNAMVANTSNHPIRQIPLGGGKTQTISGNGKATVERIGIYNTAGQEIHSILVGELMELRVHVKVNASIPCLVFGFGIKNHMGQLIYGTNTWHSGQRILAPQIGSIIVYSIKFDANIGIGSYSIQTSLHEEETHIKSNYEWRDMAIFFNVVNVGKTSFGGCAWLNTEVKIWESADVFPSD